MKIPLLLFAAFAAAGLTAAPAAFRCTPLSGAAKEAYLRLKESCPVLRVVEPGPQPWRLLAAAEQRQPLMRRERVSAENGRQFLIEYPAGEAELCLYDGDIYGTVGGLTFLLPQSERLKQALEAPEGVFASPYVQEAFNRLVNLDFTEAAVPGGFKSEYTARVTGPSLRRGCILPEPFSATAATAAVKSGANLLRFRPGENPAERLDAAEKAGAPALLDCSALPTASLATVADEVKDHPALAGIDLGAAPDAWERATAVRARAGAVPLYVSPAPFGEPDDYREFRPLPLPDVTYTVSVPRAAETLEPLSAFQRRYGARVFVRGFDTADQKRFIDDAERNGWEWVVAAPAGTLYTNCFRRNRK